MRFDINPIADSARYLLDAIERRDVEAVRSIAATYLDFLPPDNFADPEPGVTVATSVPEYTLAKLMPYVRGSVRKWHGWAAEATAESEWPDPERLRNCVGMLEELRAQVVEMTTAPVVQAIPDQS